jgi:hypothetical protein
MRWCCDDDRQHVRAARDALTRARNTDEQLRSSLAEPTVWLTLAITDGADDDTDENES